MSDETISIVRIDPTDADEVASRAIAFLLRESVIVPNPKRDALMQPSQWVAGPAAESAMRQPIQPAFWRELADTGVDVDTDRQLHHGMENQRSPAPPVGRSPSWASGGANGQASSVAQRLCSETCCH